MDANGTVGSVICPPQTYTRTPVAPPPSEVPIVGVTSSLPVKSVPADGSEAMVSDPQEVTPSVIIPKCCQIAPTPIQSPKSPIPSSSPSLSGPSTKSASYPILVVPELTIPAEAHPEQLYQLGGRKEYQCQYLHFAISTWIVF